MADTRPSRRPAPGVHAPINAASAAKRAAHAKAGQEGALRAAAAGTSHARASRPHDSGRSPRALTYAAIGIGALLALVLAFVLARAVMGAMLAPDARDTAASTQPASVNQAVTLNADDLGSTTITYGNRVYAVRSFDDGIVRVTRGTAGTSSEAVSLFDIVGTPVGLAVYDGTVYAVANLDGIYTVRAYVDADGSMPTTIAEESGNVSNVALDGSNLRLTDLDGKVFEINLADR